MPLPRRRIKIRRNSKIIAIAAAIIVLAFASILVIVHLSQRLTEDYDNWLVVYENDSQELLLNTSTCQILDLNPFDKDVMKYFKNKSFESCAMRPALTLIVQNFDTDEVLLNLNESLMRQYRENSPNSLIECCYQEIRRLESDDDSFTLGKCNYFENFASIPKPMEFILVTCTKNNTHTPHEILHKAVYATIRRKQQSNQIKIESNKRPLSVLIIGIDSLSRLNMYRAMPETAKYLQDNAWIELKAYNKIGDNTFPNVLPIVTGYSANDAYARLGFAKDQFMDHYPFIWKDYKARGYVTAQAEDFIDSSTFNHRGTQRKGFKNPPTDHYLRPMLSAAEATLNYTKNDYMVDCLGERHSADYVLRYGVDFARVYQGRRYFGFFWTNSFSHNDFSDPSAWDGKIKDYIEELDQQGTLNESLVILLSDHGMRFGPQLPLLISWYESRLPFISFSFPPWFRRENPKLIENLKTNSKRLTNPYNLYITLRHVLDLSQNGDSNMAVAYTCPKCQSLLKEISENNSCSDLAIDPEWCTCNRFQRVDPDSSMIRKATEICIEKMNSIVLQHFKNASMNLCKTIRIKRIISAERQIFSDSESSLQNFRLIFETFPSNGIYQTNVRYDGREKTFIIDKFIDYLNKYAAHSQCMTNKEFKKFCFCKDLTVNGIKAAFAGQLIGQN